MEKNRRYFQNRFSLVALLIAFFLILSFIVRTVLLLTDINQIDWHFSSLAGIYLAGAFYDLIAVFYYVSPFVFYLAFVPDKIFNSKPHRCLMGTFIFVQVCGLVFSGFAEWFFWKEFEKRFNFIAVDYLVYTHEVINNILESYPIPLLLCVILIISAIVFYLIITRTPLLSWAFTAKSSLLQRLKTGAFLLLVPIVSFYAIDKQPLSEISTNQYNNELAKNGLYSLFSAFRHNTLDYDTFYKRKSIETVMTRLYQLTGFNDKKTKIIKKEGTEKKFNVMLVMVESLSAEYMGVFGNHRRLTPHLDELTQNALFFNNFYATGTRTVRGMEAVTLSIPPTPGRSVIKRPGNEGLFSSGFIFAEKGYENKFIYAGYGYFDNMNYFFSHNGFDVVDRSNMRADEITFSNVWGACDEDLFHKVLKEADNTYRKGKPFFNFIMTTSNHRPYTFPEGKIDLPPHHGRAGGVKYTDYAIHRFLEDARDKPWFDQTIFVIVADHNGGSSGKNTLPVWRYKIPLIIYAPKIIRPGVVSKLASQVDLMPTLFSILNWGYRSRFYGKDILDDQFIPRAFIGNYQKLGYLKDGRLLVLRPDKRAIEYKIVNQTLTDVDYIEIPPAGIDELDSITYYQSASYFYKNHLSQWPAKIN